MSVIVMYVVHISIYFASSPIKINIYTYIFTHIHVHIHTPTCLYIHTKPDNVGRRHACSAHSYPPCVAPHQDPTRCWHSLQYTAVASAVCCSVLQCHVSIRHASPPASSSVLQSVAESISGSCSSSVVPAVCCSVLLCVCIHLEIPPRH